MEPQVRLRVKNSSKAVASSTENVNTSVSSGYASNEGDNIKVYVRIRPPLKHVVDSSIDQSMCLEVTSQSSLTIATKPAPKQFSFDHVAGMESTQEEVFATVGKGIIEAFVNGFNGTIFAYGQTGSGKTFTMLGPADDTDNFTHELRGVIPRGFEFMFSLINRQQEKSGDRAQFLARCSFLEIYNEQVYDLLEPSSAGLHLRENIKKGVFVEGLAERDINSAKDAYSVLQSGWLNRRVASTSMNRESSRSHAVFTVTLESRQRAGGTSNIKISKLHLVDLAGSERQKDTHTEDLRLKEAGSINKSLSALGNVIMSLVDIAHGKTRYIHYRDSKLTFILRDSLGGNAKTYIIANVHPSSRCFGETLSTLSFARRAKMIKNKAVMNEDVTGNVPELQKEIRKLKEQLSQFKASSLNPETVIKESVLNNGDASYDGGEWKEMMLSAMGERDQSEKEKSALQEKLMKLEELCSKKEKFLQSTRMILKFRIDHIAKLERQLKKIAPLSTDVEEDSKDRQIKLLREENKLLQQSIDHHPEVKRYAIENLELKAEIKRLRLLDPSNGDFSKTMTEKHRYILQLERQLRELISNSSNDQDNSSSSQQSLERSNAEIEKGKIELAQFQAKLHTSLNELLQCRETLKQSNEEINSLHETHRKKELELQSDLAAVRKSNNELERTLETFQLRTAMERSSMNSLHMQTIKTLSSPMKFGTPRSAYSTPVKSKQNCSIKKDKEKKKEKEKELLAEKQGEAYINDPNRLIEDELPPNNLADVDSFDEMSDDDAGFNPFDIALHDETQDAESIYVEALQDEIKQLQELYNQSLQMNNVEQRKKIPLEEAIAKLNHKCSNTEKQLYSERKVWSEKESDINAQVVSLRDKYKQAQNHATILKSEVDDLRIMLSSAEKQLINTKKEKGDELLDINRKFTTLESKHVKLELDMCKLQSEVDVTAEANNNLQADFEQCKDELEFSRHKNNELEEIISLERQKYKSKDEELNNITERLNFELENKIKLSQTDKEQELLHSVEVISGLRDEIKDLTKEVNKQKLHMDELSKDLEHAKTSATAQQWKSLLDKEAVNNYLLKLEEMKVNLVERESYIQTMSSEMNEVKVENEQLQKLLEEKKEKINKLGESLKVENQKFEKEKSDREKEVIGLHHENLLTQEECKELRVILVEKEETIQSLQVEILQSKLQLAEKTNKIATLEEDLIAAIKTSVTHHHPATEDHNNDVDKIARLSQEMQSAQKEKILQIEALQIQCNELEVTKSNNEFLEKRMTILEAVVTDLESEKKELNKQEKLLQATITELVQEKESFSTKIQLLNKEKDHCKLDNHKLKEQLSGLQMNMCNLQDDLDYNMEALEKTKALEESNFKEMGELKSKLEVAHEEKNRLGKHIDELSKSKDKLELEYAKSVGQQNHNQRIHYHMTLKNENFRLNEELQKVRSQLFALQDRI